VIKQRNFKKKEKKTKSGCMVGGERKGKGEIHVHGRGGEKGLTKKSETRAIAKFTGKRQSGGAAKKEGS